MQQSQQKLTEVECENARLAAKLAQLGFSIYDCDLVLYWSAETAAGRALKAFLAHAGIKHDSIESDGPPSIELKEKKHSGDLLQIYEVLPDV